MKTARYYVISYFQLFLMAVMVGIISAALSIINTAAKEYLQLPIVHNSADGTCKQVSNFKNGDAFTCHDVNVILRNYRTTND